MTELNSNPAMIEAIAAAVLSTISNEALMAEVERRGLATTGLTHESPSEDVINFLDEWTANNAAGANSAVAVWVSDFACGDYCDDVLKLTPAVRGWIESQIDQGNYEIDEDTRRDIILEWFDNNRP